MKIVHLCLGGFYFDHSTYQENLISKYHKKLGYDVEIIAPSVDQIEGKLIVEDKYKEYINEYGISVTKLPYNRPLKIARKLCKFKGIKNALEKARPDILFIHGLQSLSVIETVKYIRKNRRTLVYVDNHVDFQNSAKNIFSKELLHKGLWKYCAHLLIPYVKKFYGVLPARVEFLKTIYKIPSEKVDLLVLGVDDELFEQENHSNKREEIRRQLGISPQTSLVVTGGKINHDRPETLELIKAISEANRSDIQLLVFGKATEEYKDQFIELCKHPNIHYVGWANSKEIYDYYIAGDLIAFPGLHSVLWEQAVGCGKACIFRRIEGFTHIDVGGNCAFFDELSCEGMRRQIEGLVDHQKIREMTQIAISKGHDCFSYINIAERSIKS